MVKQGKSVDVVGAGVLIRAVLDAAGPGHAGAAARGQGSLGTAESRHASTLLLRWKSKARPGRVGR
jgi:hypothetical protein